MSQPENAPEPLRSLTSAETAALPGLFLVFEGIDGAGKTTQIRLLSERLLQMGFDVELTREPGGTEIGERIRPLLLDHGQGAVDPRTEALLYAASRAAHVEQRILPRLREGAVVLCDRYVDSSVAYQSAGRNLAVEDILAVNAFATQGLAPAATFFLMLSQDQARARRLASRGGEDRIESAGQDFHDRTRAAFMGLLDAAPEHYRVIDGARGVDEIAEDILAQCLGLLSEHGIAPQAARQGSAGTRQDGTAR